MSIEKDVVQTCAWRTRYDSHGEPFMMNTGAPPVAALPCSAAFDSASIVKSLLLQQGGVGLSSVSDADQRAATSRSSACRTFSFDGDSFARAARQQRGRSSLATATHQPQLVYIKGPLNPEFRCTGRELRFLSNTWVTHKPTFHLIIHLCQGCSSGDLPRDPACHAAPHFHPTSVSPPAVLSTSCVLPIWLRVRNHFRDTRL